MITIRRASARGHVTHEWLESWHTFSFADYYDAKYMGFRSLRVINEDRVSPGQGFGMHSHRDMEIVSYVLEGELHHNDSMGTSSVVRPGDVQRMSAGTGVRHSEFNASQVAPLHFLQIWIEPAKLGIAPGYQEKSFSQAEKRGQLRLVASRDGRAGSVTINADAVIHAGLFDAGESAQLALGADGHVWAHIARGNVRVNGVDLSAGDAVAISSEPHVQVEGISGGGELLIFELA